LIQILSNVWQSSALFTHHQAILSSRRPWPIADKVVTVDDGTVRLLCPVSLFCRVLRYCRATMLDTNNLAPGRRQPVFNLPPAIVASLAVLIGVHAARVTLLTAEADFDLLLRFAFIPLRVLEPYTIGTAIPGGPGAALWSFATYALLHADWAHLIFNGLWLAAFGSPLAWRFGTARFLSFSALGAVAGAVVFLLFNSEGLTPMIGASAAISAHMAGASRFVFLAGGPLRGLEGPQPYRRRAPPLRTVMADRRVLTFLAVWFGLNLFFGLFAGNSSFASGPIAWEAHIGGFLAGLVLFRYFDPVPRQ
jgi:membrane associated rhomboid family serine protease